LDRGARKEIAWWKKKRKEKYRPLQEGFEPDLLAAFIS